MNALGVSGHASGSRSVRAGPWSTGRDKDLPEPYLRVVVGMLIKLKIKTPGGGSGLSGNLLPP